MMGWKEMWLDVEVLDKLYESNELYHGTNVTVPWKGKGEKISHWKGVFVDSTVAQEGKY